MNSEHSMLIVLRAGMTVMRTRHIMSSMSDHRSSTRTVLIHHGAFALKLRTGINRENSVSNNLFTIRKSIENHISSTKGRTKSYLTHQEGGNIRTKLTYIDHSTLTSPENGSLGNNNLIFITFQRGRNPGSGIHFRFHLLSGISYIHTNTGSTGGSIDDRIYEGDATGKLLTGKSRKSEFHEVPLGKERKVCLKSIENSPYTGEISYVKKYTAL